MCSGRLSCEICWYQWSKSVKAIKRPRMLGLFAYIGPWLDFICVVCAGLFAYDHVYGDKEMHDRYWLAICTIGLLVLFVNAYSGSYRKYHEKSLIGAIFSLFFSWSVAALLSTSIVYFAHVADKFSRLWFVLVIFVGLMECGILRIVFYLLCYLCPLSLHRRKIYIVGDSQSLCKMQSTLNYYNKSRYELVGTTEIKAYQSVDEKLLNTDIFLKNAQEIWLAMPLEMGGNLKEVLYSIRHQTAEIRFFPEISDLPLINQHISKVLDRVSIDLSVTPMKGNAKFWKRAEDILLSVIALICFLPVFLFVALAIKLESKGPVIFKQYRTGINGKKFKVYKFRSMIVHKEQGGSVTQASRNDSRVTKVGAFLRKTSLDELPQFYNVLQGRMSVVGPRPHALAHNEYYKDLVESYMQRHKVKPGITGWAQICGYRGETDTLDKMQKRVQMDIWYICNWSLLLDIKIVFFTAFKGFLNKNAF